MADSAGTAYVEIKPDLGGFKKDLSSGLSSAASGLNNFGRTMTTRVTLPIVGVGAAAVTMGLKTAASLEQSELAFKTFYGSAEVAESVMRDIADFAAATPFELPGLTDAAMKLAAVGIEAENLMPIMQGVGDAVSGVGGGAAQIDSVTFAMQQVIGQGRAMTQDINQIANTGIPIWGELAAQMGVSTSEIRDLASEGKITSDVLMAAFTDPQGPLTTFDGMMEAQSQTLTGLWSTFKDTINIALADSLQSALPEIKSGLESLTAALGPALAAAGPAFSAIVTAMVPIIGVVADIMVAFTELSPAMQSTIVYAIAGAAALGPMALALSRFVRAFGAVASLGRAAVTFVRVAVAIGRIYGVFGLLAKAGRMLSTFVRVVVVSLRILGIAFLTNPVTLIIMAIIAAVALAAFLIYKYWDQIKAAFQTAWTFIAGVMSSLWESIKAILTVVWDGIVGFFTGIWNFVQPIWSTFWSLITLPIRIWWAVVSAIFQLAWALIKWLFQTIVDFVVPIWQSLWDTVSSAVSNVWNWIKDIFTKVWNFIKDIFTEVKNTVVDIWNTIYGWIKGKVTQIYTFYRDKFIAIKDSIVNAFNTVRDKVVAVWDKIVEKGRAAVDFIKGIGQGMWNGLKGAVNFGIGLLNSAIRGFNKVIGAVNAVPGVNVPTIPEIPKLAEGGIVARPTYALVGEAGPEAVIPLARLDRYITEGKSKQDIVLTVKIGDQDITDMIESITRRDSDRMASALARGRRL